MSKFRLIAFDMDGTLLDSTKTVRPDSIAAIRKAVENGKIAALATGRSMVELQDFRQQFTDIRYFMCTSGAVIYDNRQNEILFSRCIPQDTVMTLFEAAGNEDLMIHIHSDDMIVQKDRQSHMSDYNMGVYQGMFDRIALKPIDLEDYCRNHKPPVYKFNLYCRTAAQRDRLKDIIGSLPVSIAYAETTSLECSALGVSKGTGLSRLCSLLNIPVSETIAVGDADNDLEIFRTAGLAIAMGNANENAKALAGAIVADNDSGGCAQAICKYLL